MLILTGCLGVGGGGCGRLGGCECVGWGDVNFLKEIPLNEISENLKILLKNVRGVNFPKEIPLNEISENSKILLKNPLWRIRYFCNFFSQNPDPHKEKIFHGCNPPTCPEY